MAQDLNLPIPAWQQAAVICLFLVLIWLMLRWMSSENKTTREFQRSEATAREKAQTERDAEWRKFLATQRAADEKKSEAMTESLNALTAATQALITEVQGQRADFQAHDQREWAALGEMSKTIHTPGRKPRGGTP